METVTQQVQMVGTNKPGQITTTRLPDGRVRASIRADGSNVVHVRVGSEASVLLWVYSQVKGMVTA